MADVTSPAPTEPAEDTAPLIDVLGDLGRTLVGADLPSPSEIQHVVGAIVKVMDAAGVKVSDDLYPKEEVAAARPVDPQAHVQKTNTRLDKLEDLLERLIGHVDGSNDDEPADDTPATPPTYPTPPGASS